MKFRRAAPATLIVCVITVTLVSAAVSNRMFSGMTSTVEKDHFDRTEKVVQFNLSDAASKAQARAELFASLPTVRRLLAANDRDGLIAELLEAFEVQRDKFGVDQVQFYRPPTTSILRLHKLEAGPEDVSGFKPLVVAVERDQIARSGVSVGRSGPAIFSDVAVIDADKKFVGIVETAMSIGALLDGLKRAYGYELSFYAQEELLRTVATSAKPAIFDEKNRVGAYLRFHSTNAGLFDTLVVGDDMSNVEEPARYVRDALDKPYGVLLVPVRDPDGKPLGVVAVAQDFSGTRGAAGRSLVWQGLIALFGITLLSAAIILVIRGFLLAPLRAIVRGKPLDDDPLCEELQELARTHAELQAKADTTARVTEGGS
jgi:methyl-accepting chemotaxis protein